MVGFQTRLKWPEQKRVFSMIPGLENAEFLRYGVVHRNSYLNSPGILDVDMMFVNHKGLFAAGQLTGSEGYVESTATGAIAGISAARLALGLCTKVFPQGSCIGALAAYISKGKGTSFDPMSMNFGLLPEPSMRPKSRKSKREMQIAAAKAAFASYLAQEGGE
jgi:methylenetetrahydrofolate--tRNA-(uracil-5-)-methyltransferase